MSQRDLLRVDDYLGHILEDIDNIAEHNGFDLCRRPASV